MAEVIKFSEAASLGMHAMVLLGGEPGKVFSTGEMARKLEVSGAHLSKVLQRLTRAGLVKSVRGPKGGFVFERDNGDPTLLKVYEAIDGPLADSECLLGSPVCNRRGCILGDLLGNANKEVREYLSGTRLSELAYVYGGEKDGG